VIINIRGTSGSGKSHLVREIMALYGHKSPMMWPERKRPAGYLLHREWWQERGRRLYIAGHYETACGGCDTLPSLNHVYAMVREAHSLGHDVLYEGVIVTSDVARVIKIHQEQIPIAVIGLNTPLETCVAGVQSRRDARGDEREFNPRNTEAKMVTNVRGMEKLQAAGVDARWRSRAQALEDVRSLLGWSSC